MGLLAVRFHVPTWHERASGGSIGYGARGTRVVVALDEVAGLAGG